MDSGADFNRVQPQRPDEHLVDGRPGTAASVATSSSSFRIPGIRLSTSGRDRNPQALSQQTAPSFVRLFAPQVDVIDTSWHEREADQQEPVHWLHRQGPPPGELIDSAQGPAAELYTPRQHLLRDDTRSDGPTALPVRAGTFRSDEVRPFTASSYHRSKLITADRFVGNYVCALLENRGAGREVGIACIERETGHCIITQLVDTPTFVRTIHHFSMYPPSILLVPASGRNGGRLDLFNTTSRRAKRVRTDIFDDSDTEDDGSQDASQKKNKSLLIRSLEETYAIEAQPFPRRHWDHQEGGRRLDRLLVDDVEEVNREESELVPSEAGHDATPSQHLQRPSSSRPQTSQSSRNLNAKASTRAAILEAVADKYYLLSAFAALIEFYVETFNRVFTPKTMRIQYVLPTGTILINSNTAHDLELVRNSIDPRSKDSLYGLLNHCVSPMGQRLMRVNLLQPLSDPDSIAVRQEAVAECVKNEERYFAIHESLKPIQEGSVDLDKLIHTLSCPTKTGTDPRLETEKKLSSILSLRSLLRSLGPVRAALQNASSPLLRSISTFLDSQDVDAIHDAIEVTIDEDVKHAKGGLASRTAKMNAVRAERSPLLDVARQTYRENTDDIDQLRQRLERETELSFTLKLIPSGYLLRTVLDSNQVRELPDYFTNVTRAKSGKSVTMTTLPLKKLNARLVDSMNEVCNMSDTIIDELIKQITDLIASLNKVSEALSLLDMIFSFANVSRANSYVRPTFGDHIDIREARHPILDRVDILGVGGSSVVARRRRAFVPNDIYLSPEERVCLITGPNMSGKSTILRLIALITVLAGIGCFVPASRAKLPIPDALLSLLTHEDDPQQNLSTFAAEMRTSAFILSIASPRSLVILDELGRGTSPDEGCAVATAIVDDLINRNGCTVFFATHFGELVKGFEGKEGVVCQHLNVSMVHKMENVDLVFHHKLSLGPGLNTHYSLQVAKMMGCFEDGFQQRARDVAEAEQSTNVERTALLDRHTRNRRTVLRNVVRDLCRLADPSYVGDSPNSEDGDHAKEITGPLIAKLSLLQLHAAHEIEQTFHD